MSKPLITFVVAMAQNRVIGRDNQLPWHLPADLAHFKRLTVGKPIVMGRKVYDSIDRPLPERHNIVLTRDPNLSIPGCTVVNSRDQALAAAGPVEEVAVIGGAQIYELFLPVVDVIHLTIVEAEIAGDTYFPELPEQAWKAKEEAIRPPDEKNPYPLRFITLTRA
jgi:dihydrofolate reductase